MYLLIAATEKEMSTLHGLDCGPLDAVSTLISGVGLLETGVVVGRFLEHHHKGLTGVVNFGIGGAYRSKASDSLAVLDICLASREVLGDFGISRGETTEPFAGLDFPGQAEYDLDSELLSAARQALAENGMKYSVGSFVTVNGVSGSAARGEFLGHRYRAICENMEGAAIARVCRDFSLPFVEVRAISNLVEDRPGSPWKIMEASSLAAQAAATIVKTFLENR